MTLASTLLLAASAPAAAGPRYDVPPDFTRCAHATAWHGFFKWASVKHGTCRRAAAFMQVYGRHADAGRMPRHVDGYRCTIRYWRNADGDIYASRHVCTRDRTVVRFYGMV